MLRWLTGLWRPLATIAKTERGEVGRAKPQAGASWVMPPVGRLGLPGRAPAPDTAPGALIQALAQADPSEFATVRLVQRPSRVTPTSLSFRLGGPEGQRLRPEEQILLEVPQEFRARPLYQAILEHRQVASEKSSTLSGKSKKWDHTPGVTALHFHSTLEGELSGWRYWHAPWGSSGVQGGKYAEVREDWETESHFDFAKHGTVHVEERELSKGVLAIDALRLRGVGVDPTFVRQVTITFAPPIPDQIEEHVFTPHTSIGDLLTAAGQKFGKDYEKGTYPRALLFLDGAAGASGEAALPAGWRREQGRLHVPLKPGLRFSGVELAVGDTKPDGVLNSDGAIGSQGHSRLRAGVFRQGAAEPEWFLEDYGVPPQGVIFGGPLRELTVQAGDELVLSAEVDPTYLMAIRISYQEPE